LLAPLNDANPSIMSTTSAQQGNTVFRDKWTQGHRNRHARCSRPQGPPGNKPRLVLSRYLGFMHRRHAIAVVWTHFWGVSRVLLLPSALMRSAGSACQRLSIIWPSSSYSSLIIARSGRWLSTLAACATVFCGRCPNGFSPAQRRHEGNGEHRVRRVAHSTYTRSISRLEPCARNARKSKPCASALQNLPGHRRGAGAVVLSGERPTRDCE
jgi:hypothetical protein